MTKSVLHARYKSPGPDDGAWADFGDGIAVRIRRYKSQYVQDYLKKLNRPYADMVRRGPLPASIAQDVMEELVAYALIASWRGVTDEDGNILAPTKENKLAIIQELPEFRDEILGLSFAAS